MRFKNEYILVNLPFRHASTWNPISPYYPDEQICFLQPQKESIYTNIKMEEK